MTGPRSTQKSILLGACNHHWLKLWYARLKAGFVRRYRKKRDQRTKMVDCCSAAIKQKPITLALAVEEARDVSSHHLMRRADCRRIHLLLRFPFTPVSVSTDSRCISLPLSRFPLHILVMLRGSACREDVPSETCSLQGKFS